MTKNSSNLEPRVPKETKQFFAVWRWNVEVELNPVSAVTPQLFVHKHLLRPLYVFGSWQGHRKITFLKYFHDRIWVPSSHFLRWKENNNEGLRRTKGLPLDSQTGVQRKKTPL